MCECVRLFRKAVYCMWVYPTIFLVFSTKLPLYGIPFYLLWQVSESWAEI